jgi:hypothetical protein
MKNGHIPSPANGLAGFLHISLTTSHPMIESRRVNGGSKPGHEPGAQGMSPDEVFLTRA